MIGRDDEPSVTEHTKVTRDSGAADARELGGDLAGSHDVAPAQEVEDSPASWVGEGVEDAAYGGVRLR